MQTYVKLGVSIAMFVAGCADGDLPIEEGDDGEEVTSGSTASSSSGGEAGGSKEPETGPPVADKVELVYGHSPSVLYKLDPENNAVEVVGEFAGIDSDMIDIALDRSSNMIGTTFGGLYAIDRSTAVCTLIASGNYPNSLSFVPAGTVDAKDEALVGYEEDEYVRIDLATGELVPIGKITGYKSSGDVVSVEETGDAYLTVQDAGSGTACKDCLVKIDPSTGELIKNFGPVGHPHVFGLAFWGGSAYGFTEDGRLLQITIGTSTVTTFEIPVGGGVAELGFYGAGSTTAAPSSVPE